jgi:hypothetical protein
MKDYGNDQEKSIEFVIVNILLSLAHKNKQIRYKLMNHLTNGQITWHNLSK